MGFKAYEINRVYEINEEVRRAWLVWKESLKDKSGHGNWGLGSIPRPITNPSRSYENCSRKRAKRSSPGRLPATLEIRPSSERASMWIRKSAEVNQPAAEKRTSASVSPDWRSRSRSSLRDARRSRAITNGGIHMRIPEAFASSVHRWAFTPMIMSHSWSGISARADAAAIRGNRCLANGGTT